jgi:hypothetical protein
LAFQEGVAQVHLSKQIEIKNGRNIREVKLKEILLDQKIDQF